ncbi:Hypothetical predicted protein [Paramuricea clavata]|uniref:Uncharacterized protein n=1 Tax=Paramuricea clavata TaxID=317549 RepID=A0A6S7I2L0_PARCT|nr:Hypothetical predicted protein [Paramuricea clavata]
MSDEKHKSELTSLVEELMADIDSKPLQPKNKILLYSRYVLSKLSWHFTVTGLSKTWVIENIDSNVNSYIRKWLDIPISGTLSTVFLTRNKFGLNICPPSIKFIQCQTVLRKALKISPNLLTNFGSQPVTAKISSTSITRPSKFLRIFALDKRMDCVTN